MGWPIVMEDTLQRFLAGQIQPVYTHNDNMAFGALNAIQAAGRDKEGILIIGIDAEKRAIRAVAKGDRTATLTYSTVAPEGVFAAHALATHDMAALDKLGTLTKMAGGSMEIEIAARACQPIQGRLQDQRRVCRAHHDNNRVITGPCTTQYG